MKSTEECKMCTKKYIFIKLFAKRIITGLSQRTKVEKTVHKVETHRLSGKANIPVAAVNKKGHLRHEKTHHNF